MSSESLTEVLRGRLVAEQQKVDHLEQINQNLLAEKISAEATRFAALSILNDVVKYDTLHFGEHVISDQDWDRIVALVKNHSR